MFAPDSHSRKVGRNNRFTPNEIGGIIQIKPLNRGEPGQKADYVVMGTGSQAVLALDPRSPDPEVPPAPAGQDKET